MNSCRQRDVGGTSPRNGSGSTFLHCQVRAAAIRHPLYSFILSCQQSSLSGACDMLRSTHAQNLKTMSGDDEHGCCTVRRAEGADLDAERVK